MDTPYVREYTEDREITAWFLLDLSPSVDFGTAESDRQKRTVLIDFVTTLARLADPARQPGRGGAVRRRRRADDPGRQRPGPGPAAHRRPAPAAAHGRRAVHRPRAAARRRPPGDQAPVARVRHLGLHQRARLGAVARPARPPARGHRRSASSTRARSSCPTSGRHPRGRRDRRAALRRHRRSGAFRRRFADGRRGA